MRGSVSLFAVRGRSGPCSALWLIGLMAWSGCAHLMETRTIEAFTKALDKGDLEQLKKSTSPRFGERALRQELALEDLKVLRLPTGDIEIVEVDETSPTLKKVTVTVGESKQRLKYQLKLDPNSKKWVVDDIYLKQKHQGVTATKSVTEQMDLLLSVREFFEAWKNGGRDDVLKCTSPEFTDVLKALPPEHLSRLTQQIVGRQKTGKRLQPRAQLDEQIAYVRLPIGVGEMVLTMKNIDKRWAVDEVAINSTNEKEAIPSARQLAQITVAATGFLTAYQAGDKSALKQVTVPKFFDNSLAASDLSQVKLPGGDLSPDNVQTQIAWQGFSTSDDPQIRQLSGKHSDFIVEGPEEILKLSLLRQEGEDASQPVRYLVEDVTLFELGTKQEKRLSALFTAHALVQVFAEALAARDLETLKWTSSSDFADRVWKRVQSNTLHKLPLQGIEEGPIKIQSTVFSGAITEVTVTQGSKALTYVLQDRRGELFLDDVLVPSIGRPSSLKTTLDLVLPVLSFADGFTSGQLDVLARNSSRDFNRLVWSQSTRIPSLNFDVAAHLETRLVSIEQTGDRAVVVLGDDRFGARVTLLRESERHVIDEMVLISGTMPREHVELKRALRMNRVTASQPAATTEVIRSTLGSRPPSTQID